MDNIGSDKLFSGLMGHGLFPEKLPPLFTSVSFLNFFEQNKGNISQNNPTQYIFYESMRNTNVPRMMGIPDPISYALLCQHIKNYWSNIRSHFKKCTQDQAYKVSRIHIRQRKNDDSLFQMNYHNFKYDGDPELDLMFDAYFMVKADIAQCFPSMYSHAIAWALVGKDVAKKNKDDSSWCNQLDRLIRNTKDGETNGFLIGPHASNLLSEIILCEVDSKLKGWRYFRNIDDYTCFVKNQQEAERFLVDLKMELKEFGLFINHKKTEVIKLPVGQEESWVRKIKNNFSLYAKSPIHYPQIHAFMEFIIDLVKETENSAIINYAMKMVVKYNLTEGARLYYIKIITHLSLIYPYLYPYLDNLLFIPFDVPCETIQKISNLIYKNGNSLRNTESISYAIYFAIKYRFEIEGFDINEVLGHSDCILSITAWIYAKVNRINPEPFYNAAQELNRLPENFHRNWLFVYEVLGQKDFENTWAAMKKHKVSFCRPLDEIFAKSSPNYELTKLIFELSCNHDSFNDLIMKILDDYIANHPQANRDIYEKYFRIVILNLRIAFANRNNVKIPKMQQSYAYLGPEGTQIAMVLKDVTEWLKSNCYIGERLGDPSYGCSAYWAKEKLYSQFKDIPTGMIFFPQKYASCVIVKDLQKEVIDIPLSPKGALYKSELETINHFYTTFTFSYYPVSYNKEYIYPYLTAIFNNSSWDIGGRLYATNTRGISYQSIPSDLRKTILINGKETVEIDYSGLHVSMLYAMKVKRAPQDPYDFVSPEYRPLAKYAVLMMLNASNEREVVFNLEKRKAELSSKHGLSLKKNNLKKALKSCSNFPAFIDEIKKNNPDISEYFFSGIGTSLQNKDSLMALEIVYHFYQKGIPVLPVHDSFIIEKQYTEDLKKEMKAIFQKYNNNFECVVK